MFMQKYCVQRISSLGPNVDSVLDLALSVKLRKHLPTDSDPRPRMEGAIQATMTSTRSGIPQSDSSSTAPRAEVGPPQTVPPQRWLAVYQSPIGKKLFTGITGLALVIFVTIHMLGNLMLFVSADAYNQFGQILAQVWPLTYLIESFLLLSLVFHVSLGVQIYCNTRQARILTYADYQSAGTSKAQSPNVQSLASQRPSHQTLSSRSMIGSGAVLGGFLIWHLSTFKFGPYYEVPETGSRDLARLVIETFQQPLYTFGYVAVLSLLILHLRHGIWSAQQSLGILSQQTRPWVFNLSLGLAAFLGLGFGLLPIVIYLGGLS